MRDIFFRNLEVTSEAVGVGHPDKICDRIADVILEGYLETDPNARVACEIFASNNLVLVGGEITAIGHIDIDKKVRDVLTDVGYDANDFEILLRVRKQSPELNAIINRKHQLNVGDQCITVGFAMNETKQLMPLGYVLAQDIVQAIEKLRDDGYPVKSDMKSQVTIAYDAKGKFSISSMLVSVQHDKKLKLAELHEKISNEIMIPIAKKYQLNTNFKKFVNPGGSWWLGGLVSDTGLTGRKLAVDSYGLYARNGGGAFSGKDPTKIDRTGSYYSRWIAKHIVASGLADVCEVQLGWMIGNNTPFSMLIDCFGSNKVELDKIYKVVKECFKLTFEEIIHKFELMKCKFSQLSVYGHFGRDERKFLWEKLEISIIKSMQDLLIKK